MHDYTGERVGSAGIAVLGVNDATLNASGTYHLATGYVSYVSITTTNYAL
jgi:hypothetical protein